MSESIIYGIKKGKKSIALKDLPNSHGWGTVIWKPYFKHYLGIDTSKTYPTDEMYDRLWPLYKDSRLPEHHKTVLCASYDHTVIPVEKVYDFSKDLDMWQKDFGKDIEGYVNHIPETSAFLKEAKLKKFDFIGIQTTNIVENHYDINWNPNGRRRVSPEQIRSIYDIIEPYK